MPDLSATIVLLARDMASGTIDNVRGSLGNLTEAAGRSNSALTGILQGVELGVGIAAFGALSSAIEDTVTSSVKFQTAMTELQNNTTLTTQQTEEAGRVVIDLGNKYGVAQDQITAGYRHVMDITQDAAAAQVILNEAVEGAAASGANAATIGNVLAGVMHEYGTDVQLAADGTTDLVKTHDAAAHTLGVMTAAAQDANTTLDQWTGSLSAAIGIAASGNQPLENIGAIFGSLTLHGFPDAANAGTQVKDLFVQLAHLTPAATEELTRLGKVSGVDVVADLKAMNEGSMTLVDFLGKLRTAYQAVGLSEAQFREESEKLIAGQRGGLALNALMTTGFDDMNKIQKDLADQTRVNTVVDDTWNRTKETAGKQWDILKEQVSNFGIMLGSELLPSITPILKAMNDDLPAALAAVRGGISIVGQAFMDLGHGLSDVASPALQFLADRLADAGAAFAPWAAQAGASGDMVNKSLTGTSEVVQALQFLLQGNFKAAWGDAQAAAHDFGGEMIAIRQIIDDNRNLILATGAAFGTWAVLSTVTPALLAFGSAMTPVVAMLVGLPAAIAEVGAMFLAWPLDTVALEVGALAVALGPVTIAIGVVALAVGALTLAWANNFDDIQGKTASAASAIPSGFSAISAAVKDGTADIELAFDAITSAEKATELDAKFRSNWVPAFTNWIGTGVLPALGTATETIYSGGGGAWAGFDRWIADSGARVGAQLAQVWVPAFLKWVDTVNINIPQIMPSIAVAIADWVAGDGADALTKSGEAAGTTVLKGFVKAWSGVNVTQMIGQAMIDAATAGMQAGSGVNLRPENNIPGSTYGPTPSMTGAAARPSQFSDPQLSADEALAACGPAALVAFMRASGGRVPTLREAANIAMTPQVGGWNTEVGMVTGLSGESNLLSSYGLSSQMNQSPSEAQIQSGANSGMGEIIDTLHHFFTASGYDASTGKYNVGTSGSDLTGGSAQMTLSEMIGLEGQVVGILTDIKASTGTTADVAKASAGGTGSKDDLITYARGAAQRAGIDPDIFQRQIQQESGFDSTAKSKAGAIGIAQFMPGTAKGLGVDPTDALASLDAAAKYDADLLQKYGGSWEKTLSTYNSGSPTGGSQETADYLKIILGGTTTGSFQSPGGAVNNRQQQSATGGSDYLAGAKSADTKLQDLLTTQSIDWTKTLQTMTDRIAKAVQDEATKLAKADADAGRATEKVGTDADRAISDVGTNRGVQDQIKQQKDALALEIQNDQVANTAKVAAAELTNSRTLQDQQIVHSRALEDTQIQTQQSQAAQALTHTRALQDQEIQYQQGLQLEATAHAQKLEDAKIVSDQLLQDQATQHARTLQDQQIVRDEQLKDDATAHAQQLAQEQTLLNAKLANTQLVHQRALQDAALPVDQGLQDTATAHGRSLQDQQTVYDQQKAQQRDAAAYQIQLSQATSDAQKQQITDQHNQTVQNAALQAQYAAEDLAHSREVQDQEAKYQEGLQAAALARSRAAQDTEIQYQAAIADQQSKDANARSEKEAQYQEGLAKTALDLSRANADVETAYQRGLQKTALDQSWADAKVEQDYRDGLAKTALEHSRTLQDAEIVYQNDQAKKALDAKRVLEDAALADQRTKEDAAIQHKADMEAAARAFAAAEKIKTDAADKAAADDADKRAVAKIQADEARAKQDIADRLILQKQAIIEASQTQLATDKLTFDEAAATIIEKARIAVTKAGGDFGPIEDTMKASVAAMDTSFATAHDHSAGLLADLAAQAVSALSTKGTVPTAITDTAKVVEDQFGVSDRAVELFGQQFGLSWDVARPLLGDIEKGVYTNLGANGLIPNHIKVSNDQVIAFAKQWGVSWPEAAGILTTESDRIKATFGTGGEVPSAMAQSATAASTLNSAIQGIQDKTVTVTTNYISNGSQAASGSAGASPGAQTGSRSGGGEATGGPGPVAPSDSGGSSGGGSDDHASPTGQHIGESGPGGIYNDPSTGHPYTHAAGGVTTGPIAGIFGEAGPEAIIPLGEYFVSHKSDVGNKGPIRLHPDDIQAIADALRGVTLNVGVEGVYSGLLQKERRDGKLWTR